MYQYFLPNPRSLYYLFIFNLYVQHIISYIQCIYIYTAYTVNGVQKYFNLFIDIRIIKWEKVIQIQILENEM